MTDELVEEKDRTLREELTNEPEFKVKEGTAVEVAQVSEQESDLLMI